MKYQLTPSGREDEDFPWPATGSNRALAGCVDSAPYPGADLGVRPGESHSGRMLGAVLLLVAAAVVVALGLAWWLV